LVYEQLFRVAASKIGVHAPKVVGIFSQAVAEGKSSTWAISQLKTQGLTYKRINMLEDYRRAGSIARVAEGNVEGLRKAHNYFENVFEPFRKKEGLTTAKAWERIHMWENQQELTVEEAKRLEAQNIEYGFDSSPG